MASGTDTGRGDRRRADEAAELAREVSTILGREVKGVQSKNGIILSVPGHSLQISPGVPVDPAGCARELSRKDKLSAEEISRLLKPLYDKALKEGVKAEEQRLLDALK